MTFARDENNNPIICMAPRKGVTLGTTVTPEDNEIYRLASDVTITLDGIAVPYYEGSEVCLVKGLTYTLSVATDAHKM